MRLTSSWQLRRGAEVLNRLHTKEQAMDSQTTTLTAADEKAIRAIISG